MRQLIDGLSRLTIIGIVIILIGILCLLITLLLRKKFKIAGLISALVTGVLLIFSGCFFIRQDISLRSTARQNTYIALEFLKDGNTELANYYPNRKDEDDFTSGAAKLVLEYMRGNASIAQLRNQSLQTLVKNDDQKKLQEKINKVAEDGSISDEEKLQKYEKYAKTIASSMLISKKDKEYAKDAYQDLGGSSLMYAMNADQSGMGYNSFDASQYGYNYGNTYYDSGNDDEEDDNNNSEDDEEDEDSKDKKRRSSKDDSGSERNLRAAVNRSLLIKNYDGALSSASTLVDKHGNAFNRLLLAEAIAEAVYTGDDIDTEALRAEKAPFGILEGSEAEKLESRIEELEDELGEKKRRKNQDDDNEEADKDEKDDMYVDEDDVDENDSSTTDQNSEDKAAARKELKELRNKQKYLYIYRAFNSIADIHTLNAKIVRAKLYYAMRDYDKAMEELQKAATSFSSKFTMNTKIENALNAVNEAAAKNGQNAGAYQTEAFQSNMSTLLSYAAGNMVGVGTSTLTKDFSKYIGTSQGDEKNSLSVSGIDLTQFPDITLTLGGTEQAVQEIADNAGTVHLRDTKQDIDSFTVLPQDEDSATTDVCVVVDESGSMDGQPMNDLKQALLEFNDQLNPEIALSIVGFEDDYSILCPLTKDRNQTYLTTEQLAGTGGTNIPAGIQGAIEALSGSANTKICLLMTDGQSSFDNNVLSEAVAAGITINTIGFGDVDEELLTMIAEQTGGTFVRADSSSDLINVYLSFVKVIGNSVKIQYTAKDTNQDILRYAFVHEDKNNLSTYYNYRFQKKETVTVQSVNPAVLTSYDIDPTRSYNSEIRLTLQGENLGLVQDVSINGKAATIGDRYTNYINITAPVNAFKAGWQTINCTLTDGSTLTLDHALAAGESIYARQFSYGNLKINSNYSLILPDNTLILGNPQLSDRDVNSGNETTDVNVEGLLYTSVDPNTAQMLMSDDYYYDHYNDRIAIAGSSVPGYGVVTMNYDDLAKTDYGQSYLVGGDFHLTSADGTHVEIVEGK